MNVTHAKHSLHGLNHRRHGLNIRPLDPIGYLFFERFFIAVNAMYIGMCVAFIAFAWENLCHVITQFMNLTCFSYIFFFGIASGTNLVGLLCKQSQWFQWIMIFHSTWFGHRIHPKMKRNINWPLKKWRRRIQCTCHMNLVCYRSLTDLHSSTTQLKHSKKVELCSLNATYAKNKQ